MIRLSNLVFILVVPVLLFGGCGGDGDEQAVQPPENVEQEISQFSLTQSREGRTKWKLDADTATYLESNEVAIGKVKLVIFGDEDGETMTIHGDKGELNENTYDVKIMGNVVGISSQGGRLETEELYWRDRTGKIYTEAGVKVTITYEDSVIVGEQLLADPELETARLRKMAGTTWVEDKGSEKSAD